MPIQGFDTIVSSEISLEMEALNVCKYSLISMEIETFDRLRRIVVNWITTQKVVSTYKDRSIYIFCDSVLKKNYYLLKK